MDDKEVPEEDMTAKRIRPVDKMMEFKVMQWWMVKEYRKWSRKVQLYFMLT